MATAREEIGKDVENLKKDIENLRSDLNEMLSTVGSYSKDKVMDSKLRLRRAMDDLRGRTRTGAGRAYGTTKDYGREAVESSRACIERRPFTAVAVSFAAGLLLAALVGKGRQ
jgi:ElaB/YqjD/DUF883 family membrane-anchored ribosome-binding protein